MEHTKAKMSEHISWALVARCSLSGFRGLPKAKLQGESRDEEDHERVLQNMTKASEEWELVGMDLRISVRIRWIASPDVQEVLLRISAW